MPLTVIWVIKTSAPTGLANNGFDLSSVDATPEAPEDQLGPKVNGLRLIWTIPPGFPAEKMRIEETLRHPFA